MKNDDESIIARTKNWISDFIIAHNICPFAKDPFELNRIGYHLSSNTEIERMMQEFADFAIDNSSRSKDELSNAFFIFGEWNPNFDEFLYFYYMCEELINNIEILNIFQLVPFHPAFVYEGEDNEDPVNLTNRSPYPMLHLLRVDEVADAIRSHPDTNKISEKNRNFLSNRSFKSKK